jgi:transcription elongation factor Elf1
MAKNKTSKVFYCPNCGNGAKLVARAQMTILLKNGVAAATRICKKCDGAFTIRLQKIKNEEASETNLAVCGIYDKRSEKKRAAGESDPSSSFLR